MFTPLQLFCMTSSLCLSLALAGCIEKKDTNDVADSLGDGRVQYEANWESLGTRPIPDWWQDAKFGLVVHWGVYSVPAYAPLESSAEWYGESMNPMASSDEIAERHKLLRAKTRAWHVEQYGELFKYKDFAPLWRAELWEPDEWAALFQQSGAKYVLLTAKHHDGFALWPSREASLNWRRPWNSEETGPKRDIVGELTQAVRSNTDLKMGLYYSLYEWYNPLYLTDNADAKALDNYVSNHLSPQFKDMVTRYQPDIVWGDGAANHSSASLRTPELLAWMYNTQPSGDEVVINDRWGRDTPEQVGISTRSNPTEQNDGQAWEQRRAMGYSYAYNRIENAEDYASKDELIMLLVDTVSRGGALSLGVSARADGKIPPVQQERLQQIGDWLAIYGEGIYGSRTFKEGFQWSKGELPRLSNETAAADYDILRLTTEPKQGEARKEILYTQKNGNLYAFLTKLPGKTITFDNVTLSKKSSITMMGADGEKPLKLRWRRSKDKIVAQVPSIPASVIQAGAPYGFKLSRVRNLD